MKETALISVLALALFLLKVSAKTSLPFHLSDSSASSSSAKLSGLPTLCGEAVGGRECPDGKCCSLEGYCGTGEAYCAPENCQSNCDEPPEPELECGDQAGGKECPNGECCSIFGSCGTTEDHCWKPFCQSQCNEPPLPPEPERCGREGGGKECPTGECCSVFGSCGTTEEHCEEPFCQSQCKTSLNKNRMLRGTRSFFLNAL
ncbi:chitin-binding lectin 1-like [Capsicum annuum]|uniref:chitin-binding lectin 1-like n=1 Tax=Capsicum annuum TaxID=4072 RepID=UPI0007BF7EC6|nr:chitin-binding lectin 1-like [Capsicum annuum]